MSDSEHSGFAYGRERVISGIGSPLGFFVLALLIVEAFLLGAGKLFDLPVETRAGMVYVAVILFAGVVGIVVYLVINHPQSLVFSERSHLSYAKLQIFGHSAKPMTSDDLNRILPVSSFGESVQQLPAAQAGGVEDA